MNNDKVFFSTVKEDHGLYYIQYIPPRGGLRFANVQLIFPSETSLRQVAGAMEIEARAWVARYSVPVMVSSFGPDGGLQSLEPERPCDHLIAFKDKQSSKLCLYWELIGDDMIPGDALDPDWLRSVYADIPFKTQLEVQENAKRHSKQLRFGRVILLFWLAVIPAAWAIIQWLGPNWLATGVTVYAVWQATKKGLKLSGRWQKSSRELEKEELDRKMLHYFYHCEQNPEAFTRLKSENFDREAREEIQKEADQLKGKRRD